MAEIDLRADAPARTFTVVDRGDVTRPKREEVAAPKKAITFEMVAEDLIADRAIGWRNGKSETQWWSSLKDYVSRTLAAKYLPKSRLMTFLEC